MFGLFRSPPFNDPVLGVFERLRGRWRGSLVLVGKPLPLALAGARGAPDADALAIAKLLPAAWSSNSEAVARALIEHFEPYREAVAGGELGPPSRQLPVITHPADVWQYVVNFKSNFTSGLSTKHELHAKLKVLDGEHGQSAGVGRCGTHKGAQV